MKNLLTQAFTEAVNRLPQTAKIIVFIVLFGAIFTLWNNILWIPLQHKKAALQKKIVDLNKGTQTLQQAITLIQNNATNQPSGQQLENTNLSRSPRQALPKNISQTLRTLLSTGKLNFINIDTSPTSITSDPTTQQKTFEYKTIIRFTGNYFATIAYIEAIEKLNWPIYWDNLTYTVTNYPEANITLEIRTTSL